MIQAVKWITLQFAIILTVVSMAFPIYLLLKPWVPAIENAIKTLTYTFILIIFFLVYQYDQIKEENMRMNFKCGVSK